MLRYGDVSGAVQGKRKSSVGTRALLLSEAEHHRLIEQSYAGKAFLFLLRLSRNKRYVRTYKPPILCAGDGSAPAALPSASPDLIDSGSHAGSF